jgi:hypothetical protein
MRSMLNALKPMIFAVAILIASQRYNARPCYNSLTD